MSNEPKCKITVIKTNLNEDLAKKYMIDEYQSIQKCEIFKEGQEFIIEGFENLVKIPEGFCDWAWADIKKDISSVMLGAKSPGFKDENIAVASCSDWFRPVIFEIKKID